MARRTLTTAAVRGRLQAATGDNVAEWAERHGVSKAYVYMVLQGVREPGASICKALGVRRGTSYWIED